MHTDQKNAKKTGPLAIVVSRFNEEVTSLLLKGALDRAKEHRFKEDEISVFWVPGAVEIPILLQRLAQTGEYDALIALGAVIRGDTTHYDYVCEMVTQGCLRVSLEQDLPVIFGVLTTENDEQALARAGGTHGNKGADAIDAACEMMQVLSEI